MGPSRFLLGAGGLALVAQAVARRTFASGTLGVLGLGLAARAFSNLDLRRVLGTGRGRCAVDVQKAMHIAAPVEIVFEFWRRYENFPRFMGNVEITQIVPNKVIAWKTLPGATVEHVGIVRFQPDPGGSTSVNVRMSYDPPAGAVGQTVATLFGADPKTEIDADLARMKTLIETGARPDGAETYVH